MNYDSQQLLMGVAAFMVLGIIYEMVSRTDSSLVPLNWSGVFEG